MPDNLQFKDRRSKRVVLVAHCVLNQNAKLDRCAHYPGAMVEVARALIDSGVGIVQMPCPELLCLGLDRAVAAGGRPTVEEEDTRIGRLMAADEARGTCLRLARELAFQVSEYLANGFEVVGVIGINGSPTCGVESGWSDGWETPEPGVFIEALAETFRAEGIEVPIRGVRAIEPEAASKVVQELLAHCP